MADRDSHPGSDETAGPTRYNGTKPHAGDRPFGLPGAAGRRDTSERRGRDYVESQPGGRREDLMDRQNQPPGRKPEDAGD